MENQKRYARPTDFSQTLMSNLIKLQKESGLSQAQIASIADLPASTISGILIGTTLNPKLYTLSALARVFNKSVGQLIGEVPLSYYSKTLPILNWSSINVEQKKIFANIENNTEYLSVTMQANNDIYAFKVHPNISSMYKKDALIIVEESDQFAHLDFIIISINGSEPVIKKALREGHDIFLESTSYNIPATVYNKHNSHIFGIIRETRF